jgi:hypothetical protein
VAPRPRGLRSLHARSAVLRLGGGHERSPAHDARGRGRRSWGEGPHDHRRPRHDEEGRGHDEGARLAHGQDRSASQHRDPALQPVAQPHAGRARGRVGGRSGPSQSPHAQQAVRGRQPGGHHRRAQHRRRVSRAEPEVQLLRPRRARGGPDGPAGLRRLRSLLEQPAGRGGRPPRARGHAGRSARDDGEGPRAPRPRARACALPSGATGLDRGARRPAGDPRAGPEPSGGGPTRPGIGQALDAARHRDPDRDGQARAPDRERLHHPRPGHDRAACAA